MLQNPGGGAHSGHPTYEDAAAEFFAEQRMAVLSRAHDMMERFGYEYDQKEVLFFHIPWAGKSPVDHWFVGSVV